MILLDRLRYRFRPVDTHGMNKPTQISGIIALIMTVCIVASARAVEVPFDPSRGLVEVNVLVDGRASGLFGIDTGADRLYVNSEFVEDNDLHPKSGPPQRPIVGVHGTSEAKALDIRSLRIGNETLYNLDATVIDLSALVSDEVTDHPDGLIGYEVLKRFYVTVDFPNRLMQLRTGEPDDIQAVRKSFIPFRQERHMIVVDVVFNDDIEVPMVLDYCASQTSLSPDLADDLGLDAEVGDRMVIDKVELSGKLASYNVPCVVTDMSRIKDAVRGVDIEGLLGGTFLQGFKITIDYTRKKIYLHPR